VKTKRKDPEDQSNTEHSEDITLPGRLDELSRDYKPSCNKQVRACAFVGEGMNRKMEHENSA
jgi:hypothetical protein